MQAWLCPIKGLSWNIIKREKVFGAPKQAYKSISQVALCDHLVFYLLGPVKGIVAVYDVVSTVYEDHSDIWGKERYPLRLRIEPVCRLEKGKSPIPLSYVFGGNSQTNLVIEPFFKGVWIVRMEKGPYSKLEKLF